MECIKRGQAQVLIVWKYDRLARKQEYQHVIMYQVEEKYGGRIESTLEPRDDSPVGKLIRSVYGFTAELEAENIQLRTREGKRNKVEKGKMLGCGVMLYGYRWRDDAKTAYEPDPDTAPVVKRIFKQLAEGLPVREVARRLNADAVPTGSQVLAANSGKVSKRRVSPLWQGPVIHRIVRNPAYMGKYDAYHYTTAETTRSNETNGSKHTTIRGVLRTADDSQRVRLPESACPALVEESLWFAAQRAMEQRKRAASRNNKNPEAYLLRGGYARCGHCHSKMLAVIRKTDGVAYPNYVCMRRKTVVDDPALACPGGGFVYSAKKLDDAIWNGVLKPLLSKPDAIKLAVASRKSSRKPVETLRAEHREQVAALIARQEQKQKNLIATSAYASDSDSRTELAKSLDEVMSELRKLREELGRLDNDIEQAQQYEQELDAIVSEAAQWREDLDNLTYAQKRRLLDLFGVRVYLRRKDSPFPSGERWQVVFDTRLAVQAVGGDMADYESAFDASFLLELEEQFPSRRNARVALEVIRAEARKLAANGQPAAFEFAAKDDAVLTVLSPERLDCVTELSKSL